MSTARELGHKVGDRFVALKDDTFSKGSVIELYRDDGSYAPLFKLIKGECDYTCANDQPGAYECFDDLRKVEDEPECPEATEAPLQTIEQLVEENVGLMSQMEKMSTRLAKKQEFYRANANEITQRTSAGLSNTLPG